MVLCFWFLFLILIWSLFLTFFLLTVHQCSRTLLFTWIMVNIGLVVQLYTKGSLTERSLKRVSRKYTETCTGKLPALIHTKKLTPDSNSPGHAQYTVLFVMKRFYVANICTLFLRCNYDRAGFWRNGGFAKRKLLILTPPAPIPANSAATKPPRSWSGWCCSSEAVKSPSFEGWQACWMFPSDISSGFSCSRFLLTN